jgi:succinate dehydrogenase / fumarate reductase flavoprotein subunit
MPVKPGQHYAMGGVETDENGETCLEGLYAAGECACASVHGANRLGGNALPELVVFGARAGAHAAGKDLGEARISTGRTGDTEAGDVDTPVAPGALDAAGADSDDDALADGGSADGETVVSRAVEAERERVETLLEREDGVNHAAVRGDVQTTMTEHVNVFREEAGLKQALEELRAARERYRDVSVRDPSRTFNTDLIQTLETRNIIDLAEAITLGALARDEFRGAHWRRGHQERKDDEWLKHTMLSWNGGDPELWYKPVILEGEEETYEPKTRSY